MEEDSDAQETFEYCIHKECKSFTPTLQEGDHKHATNENSKQEDVEISKTIEKIVGIPKRATTSSNSPPKEGDKGECARYKSAFNQVAFKYVTWKILT